MADKINRCPRNPSTNLTGYKSTSGLVNLFIFHVVKIVWPLLPKPSMYISCVYNLISATSYKNMYRAFLLVIYTIKYIYYTQKYWRNCKINLGPFSLCPVSYKCLITLTGRISFVLPIEFCQLVSTETSPDMVRTALNLYMYSCY